jgi:hypothetical protein
MIARTAVVEVYTAPPTGSTVICADELGPVIPRTFAPAPGWSPGRHRIKAPLEYSRGQPWDMVAVSRQFPVMQLVVYHVGWTPQHIEGPYNPADPAGVDSLLRALDRYRARRTATFWADLATVWRSLLADSVQAAHVLGKLLRRLGEDRVAHPGGFREAHPEDHRVALAGRQS